MEGSLMLCSARVAALLIASIILSPRADCAQQKPAAAEQVLFGDANRERSARGLSALKWDKTLARAARKHARLMAQKNSLSHQFPGEPALNVRAMRVGARFTEIAENVAEARSAGVIHAEWMKSPPHRANLLDPDLDSVGIAVAKRHGQLFAVEDFARAVPNLSLKDQEKQLAALLKARGLRLLDDLADARRTCAMDRGYAGKNRPRYVARFETPDLNDLPADLKRQIKSGRYHSAVAGACEPRSTSAFLNYRVVVLLY